MSGCIVIAAVSPLQKELPWVGAALAVVAGVVYGMATGWLPVTIGCALAIFIIARHFAD